MSKSAKEIVTSSMKKIGVIAAGEAPTASELQDGVSVLQGMIDSWSLNDLLAVSETEETFSLEPLKSEYTIGAGGDFDTSRPLEILYAAIVESSGLEYRLNSLKFEQWNAIGLKTIQSNIPTNFYFRTDWPLGKIFIYPVPSQAKNIKLISRKPFLTIANATDELGLPGFYENALIYNLCLEIADEYGKAPSPNIITQARNTKLAIKNQNLSKNVPFAYTDPALRGSAAKTGWTLADFYKGGG